MQSIREEHLLFPWKQPAQQMAFTFRALTVSGLETIILKRRGRKFGFLGMCSSNGDGLLSATWGEKSMAILSEAPILYMALYCLDMC